MFGNNPRQKYCSNDCRNEGWKRYLAKRYAEKVLMEQERCANLQSKTYVRIEHRKFFTKNDGIIIQWTEETSQKMGELVNRQQFIPKYVKKDYCEVCGIRKRDDQTVILYKHHIRYSPQEIVTLCSSCHAFLHQSILKHRKCNGF